MVARALPTSGQLAALGAVLCQFRPSTGGELGGWARAVSAETWALFDIALATIGQHPALAERDAAIPPLPDSTPPIVSVFWFAP